MLKGQRDDRGQEDPAFCSKLLSELASLRPASQLSFASMNEVLQRIGTDLESASEELARHAADYDVAQQAQEVTLAPIQPLGSSKGAA